MPNTHHCAGSELTCRTAACCALVPVIPLFPLCQRTSRGNCRRRFSLNGIRRKLFSAIQDRGNRCSAICQTTTFVGSIGSQSRSPAPRPFVRFFGSYSEWIGFHGLKAVTLSAIFGERANTAYSGLVVGPAKISNLGEQFFPFC